jgi:hypothetical protein
VDIMAIARPTTFQGDPELTYKDPNAYIAYLRTQGLPPQQVYQMVTQRFGMPKTPEEQARDRASQAQTAGLAQTGGALAGTIGAGYLTSQLLGSGTSAIAPTVLGTTGAGATGAGTVATPTLVSATTTGAPASGAGAVGGIALPVAAAAITLNNAWETGMKDILRGRGTREDYLNQAANISPVGRIANIGLRLAGKRSIGQMMTTGKSDAQLMRDDFRGVLKETGVADKNYQVSLADGSKFNIGLDGKTRYTNVGENIDGKTTRQAWDVDFSNPLAKFATDQIDPMIRNIYAEAPKSVKPEQYTGMLVNAATSNAKSEQDVLNNIQAMLGKSTFAKQAGVGVQGPIAPVQRPPKGQVVRVSPGMYMNDKGRVGPAKTVRESLSANYKAGKGK